MRCQRDDMGNCCGICVDPAYKKTDLKVIAVIPVHGRLPLLRHTIERLYKKNGVAKVICVGETAEERQTCEAAGAEFHNHRNNPLGQKWNAGFRIAKTYSPDACVFVGSSDWLSDNWLTRLSPFLESYDMVGMPGCYFADISQPLHNGDGYRLVHWKGYEGRREGESIGIGRLLSRRALDAIGWQPFENHLNNSLDYSMYEKINDSKRTLFSDNDVFSLSISTNQWPNKHKFEQHWGGFIDSDKVREPVPFLMKHFPEIFQVFE